MIKRYQLHLLSIKLALFFMPTLSAMQKEQPKTLDLKKFVSSLNVVPIPKTLIKSLPAELQNFCIEQHFKHRKQLWYCSEVTSQQQSSEGQHFVDFLDIATIIWSGIQWNNNINTFRSEPNFFKKTIIISNTQSQEIVSILHYIPAAQTFDINTDRSSFLISAPTRGMKASKTTLWQRYTDHTEEQAILYWLLHKWALIKKLSTSITNMEKYIEDIVTYLPLDKIVLLAIWDSFPKAIKQSLWKHKFSYFIKGPKKYKCFGGYHGDSCGNFSA